MPFSWRKNVDGATHSPISETKTYLPKSSSAYFPKADERGRLPRCAQKIAQELAMTGKSETPKGWHNYSLRCAGGGLAIVATEITLQSLRADTDTPLKSTDSSSQKKTPHGSSEGSVKGPLRRAEKSVPERENRPAEIGNVLNEIVYPVCTGLRSVLFGCSLRAIDATRRTPYQRRRVFSPKRKFVIEFNFL